MSNRFTDQLSPIEKKKVINAWAFYDWANSVYNLTITSTIFPIYWSAVSTSNGSTKVLFFGHSFENTALYSYALSFSFLFVALLSRL
jgi:UMF1 family MFS transporter